jgi:hypothetical protein
MRYVEAARLRVSAADLTLSPDELHRLTAAAL